MPRYAADPHWLTARFPSRCSTADCTNEIAKGDRVFYYPKGKVAYCTACSAVIGPRAAAELAADDLGCW